MSTMSDDMFELAVTSPLKKLQQAYGEFLDRAGIPSHTAWQEEEEE